MKYEIKKNKIVITGKEDFNTQHILECGQIFAFDGNVVYSKEERAIINETVSGFEIECSNAKYFENFFDLKTDYSFFSLNLGFILNVLILLFFLYRQVNSLILKV